MNQAIVKLLTEATIASTRRSRNIFSGTLILSALNWVASYNLYGSWLRRYALCTSVSKNVALAANQLELMKQWIESTFLSIPVLGIKIHSSDASLAGSIAIFFFLLATMFAMRKQNHSIGQAARRISHLQDINLLR